MALIIVLFCAILNGRHLVESSTVVRGRVDGLTSPPSVSNGIVTFSETESIKLIDIDVTELQMTLVDIGNPVNHPSNPDHNSAYYISPDGQVSCIENCSPTGNCLSRCIKRTSSGLRYYTNDAILEIQLYQGTSDPADVIEAVPSEAFESTRRKRSTPTVASNTIRIVYAVDKEFMQTFLPLTSHNATEAKKEAEFYIMIQTCETALHFASVERHNVILTMDGADNVLHFTAYLGHIHFPEVTSDGKNYINPSWSQNNREGNSLVSTRVEVYTSRSFIEQTNVTVDFAKFVDDTHTQPHEFDLAIAITGHDIMTETYGKKSRNSERYYLKRKDELVKASVYSRSACRLLPTGDFNVGVVEANTVGLSAFISQVITVMLGVDYKVFTTCGAAHAVGNTFTFLSDNEGTEFSTFSSCHANQISTYLSGIPTSERFPRCMLIYGFTDAGFLTTYCDNGTSPTLDEQCTTFRGTTSTVCAVDNAYQNQGYVANTECLNRDNYVIVKCSINNSCEGVMDGIKRVETGTKCLNSDGTQGNSICFEGECKDADLLCVD
ncbi:hypothetical protein ACF0H5_012682 [Mactra antiquata]